MDDQPRENFQELLFQRFGSTNSKPDSTSNVMDIEASNERQVILDKPDENITSSNVKGNEATKVSNQGSKIDINAQDTKQNQLVNEKIQSFMQNLRKEYGARTTTRALMEHVSSLKMHFLDSDNKKEGRVANSKKRPATDKIFLSSEAKGTPDQCLISGSKNARVTDCNNKNLRGSGHVACREKGCSKLNKGGGYCIRHGGGPRCKAKGCLKGAVNSEHCVQHGGGTRCKHDNCRKVAVSAKACRGHGGGRRCLEEDCKRGALGSTNFCRTHGGGKVCSKEGCMRLSQGDELCLQHGGKYRCQIKDCNRRRGNNGLCRVHTGNSDSSSICLTTQTNSQSIDTIRSGDIS